MSDVTALMLRAVSEQLKQQIVPNLTAADAIERATLSIQVLEHLAADFDTLAQVAVDYTPELRGRLTEALASLPRETFPELLDSWRSRLGEIAPETDLACQREIRALRDLSSQILRTCADQYDALPEGDTQAAISTVAVSLGTQDKRLLDAVAAARSAQLNKGQGNNARQGTESATPASVDLTPEAVTAYLRRHYPDSPGIQATQVESIPGGRSKKTWFISLENTEALPADLVMRQDYQLHYEGTKVRDEYEPLLKFSGLGLPVPAPLLLESEETSLGQPFLLMERLEGSPPGSYFGLRDKCPGAFADLANTLAKIHQVNPAELGFTSDGAPEQSLSRLIDSYQEKWRTNSNKPSPIIDYAYSWARQLCRQGPGGVVVVHGDVGPHNMLVANDRLTALLDWEFSHLGDPAEDLGIARVYAEDVMTWDEFIRLYREAGGPPVPERRIELAMVLHFLKGARLVAVSGRNFEEGWTSEFIKGATAFSGLRQIELIVASLLQRFKAIA
ncbi:MAG: phosphotransferase family protein [Halieaceae bacterium]|nr:phosphotransferase family protein [Halieaceae bacterium]